MSYGFDVWIFLFFCAMISAKNITIDYQYLTALMLGFWVMRGDF